jgi:predicted ATPase
VDHFVVISGCSGGGKSTLLTELSRRGRAVVAEPGRRIVQAELKGDELALPWVDGAAFARRVIEMAIADRDRVGALKGWVFFDRGLVDAASGLQHVTGEQVLGPLGQPYRYHRCVFLVPPWPEIYVNDPERRHGFDAALEEYARLLEAYPALGYNVVVLPKMGVSERADFVLDTLAELP